MEDGSVKGKDELIGPHAIAAEVLPSGAGQGSVDWHGLERSGRLGKAMEARVSACQKPVLWASLPGALTDSRSMRRFLEREHGVLAEGRKTPCLRLSGRTSGQKGTVRSRYSM